MTCLPVWEGWKAPANDEWLHTGTIIIGEPNELREIHWIPIILPEEHHDARLSDEAGKKVLVCLEQRAIYAKRIARHPKKYGAFGSYL